MKRTIKIHVAGQPYQVRSDADESYVQSLAAYVNSRVDALKGGRQVATQSDVVLAALQLADELAAHRREQTRLRVQVREHAERMLRNLGRLTQAGPGPSVNAGSVAGVEVLAAAAVQPGPARKAAAPAPRRSTAAKAGRAGHA